MDVTYRVGWSAIGEQAACSRDSPQPGPAANPGGESVETATVPTCDGGPPDSIGLPTAWHVAPSILRAAVPPPGPGSSSAKATTSTTPAKSAQGRFAAELRCRRKAAGCSQRVVGEAVFASREWVTKIEAGCRWPDRHFAEAVDRLLGAGTELLQLWTEGDAERTVAQRQRAITERRQGPRELPAARGDQSIRQVLGRANDGFAVAPEIIVVAITALMRIVADRIDGGEIVRQVGDLEQRAMLREFSSVRLRVVVSLALDLAGASDLLNLPRDEPLRARLTRLTLLDEGFDQSTWSTSASSTRVDGAPNPADAADPSRWTAPSARTTQSIERPPRRAVSLTSKTVHDAPRFAALDTPGPAAGRSQVNNGAGRPPPLADQVELFGHSADALVLDIKLRTDGLSTAQLALDHRFAETPRGGMADFLGAPRRIRRPSRRGLGPRCGAQTHGLNGQRRPEPAAHGGSEPRRRTTDGRVQPACASAVPRRALLRSAGICGNECDQGRGAAYETSAGCRSQMAAVAGGTNRDPPASSRRSRCGTPVERAARTAWAGCSIRAQGEARVATSTGTSGDDHALSVMGSALRYQHRTAANGACAAGCRQQVPCSGQRLGTYALQAAGGSWHEQFSARVDVLTSGIRHDG
ncbi:helix-turn-helix transcriptional regulator [Dactylosporangium sp. NPDC050688]|uniref:helix-turn-helix domain-containing protein n=1 Tax=Dactylosporangium sp. NPDC050688 TaxID=3157217 RepID=UPI0033D6AF92